MTFVKYNENGTIVLQPAALMFSGLDSSDLLELHLLDHTMVLLDTEMTVTECANAVSSLLRLADEMIQKLAEHKLAGQKPKNSEEPLTLTLNTDRKAVLPCNTLEELESCGLSVDMLKEMLSALEHSHGN